MSLLIPCEYGPVNPVKEIVVDISEEGNVDLDLSRVTEPDFRCITLSRTEAREVACALLHYASEGER